MATLRTALPALAATLGVIGGLSGSAQALTPGHGVAAQRANVAGTYNGKIDQVVPQSYTGHIHFVVTRGKITGLRFTAGTLCGVLWVVDRDHTMPTFPLKVGSDGSFSYRGTVNGRLIRLRGTLKGSHAHGKFFQAFPWGRSRCTMGQPASFTATR